MAATRHTTGVVIVLWLNILGCPSIPLRDGSGTFNSLKVDSETIIGQAWVTYTLDQEGSGGGGGLEASQFSSSYGQIPIYEEGDSSNGDLSLIEALSSNNLDSFDATLMNSEISFSNGEESTDAIEEDKEGEESSKFDGEQNEIGDGGTVETSMGVTDVNNGNASVNGGTNEILGRLPDEPAKPPSSEDNVILGDVRNSPPISNNDGKVIDQGRNQNDVSYFIEGAGTLANGGDDSAGKHVGGPGEGVVAVVMFGAAVGVGALLSFLFVNIPKLFRVILRKTADP